MSDLAVFLSFYATRVDPDPLTLRPSGLPETTMFGRTIADEPAVDDAVDRPGHDVNPICRPSRAQTTSPDSFTWTFTASY